MCTDVCVCVCVLVVVVVLGLWWACGGLVVVDRVQ